MEMTRIDQGTLSEDEYLSLPTSIQKKYFSSLERLHIAARHFHDQLNACQSPLRSFDGSQAQSPFRWRRSRPRLNRHQFAAFNLALASHAEYQWFNSLPEKIRRQQFSVEERRILTSAFKRGDKRDPARPPPSPQKIVAAENSSAERQTVSRGRSLRRLSFRQRRPKHQSSPSPRTLPRRRILSPTSAQSRTGILDRPHTTCLDDPDTMYYQDPKVRNRVRDYLTSPQKFDEVLTFGFPSSSNPPPEKERKSSVSTVVSVASTVSVNNDVKAFLRNDSISFIDETEEDCVDDLSLSSSSVEDFDSPKTPDDVEFPFKVSNRMSIFDGLDSDSLPSLDLKFLPEEPLINALANREMTIRMTLTRPDLRTNDDELKGWNSNQPTFRRGPLALQELPPIVEDQTGMHGAFAVERKPSSKTSIFSKMLRKARNGR